MLQEKRVRREELKKKHAEGKDKKKQREEIENRKNKRSDEIKIEERFEKYEDSGTNFKERKHHETDKDDDEDKVVYDDDSEADLKPNSLYADIDLTEQIGDSRCPFCGKGNPNKSWI